MTSIVEGMTSIVERLRLLVPSDSSGAAFDAVNEITRLAAEVENRRLLTAANESAYVRALKMRDHEITRLAARVTELEGALKEAGRVLDWAARKMKGNCAGSDINTVMMAAGRTAEARAALTHPIADFLAAQEPLGAECERVWDANADKLYA